MVAQGSMGHRGKQSKRTRLLHSRSSVQPAPRAVWLRGSRTLHLLVQSQELHERERKAIFRVPSSHCALLCIMPQAAPISVAMPLDRGWGDGDIPQLWLNSTEDAHTGLGLLSPSVVQGCLLVENWLQGAGSTQPGLEGGGVGGGEADLFQHASPELGKVCSTPAPSLSMQRG